MPRIELLLQLSARRRQACVPPSHLGLHLLFDGGLQGLLVHHVLLPTGQNPPASGCSCRSLFVHEACGKVLHHGCVGRVSGALCPALFPRLDLRGSTQLVHHLVLLLPVGLLRARLYATCASSRAASASWTAA